MFQRLHFQRICIGLTYKLKKDTSLNSGIWFAGLEMFLSLLHIKPWEWDVGQISYGSEDNCRSVFALEPRKPDTRIETDHF